MKGLVRVGKKNKLDPQYVGPFKILERIGLVTYCLALPPELERIHDIFLVFQLGKYKPDLSHIISLEPL